MGLLYNIYQTLEVPFFSTDMKIKLAKFSGNWLPSYADGQLICSTLIGKS